MNLVLLSGGSGKRLWPLSNDIRSKQFIKFFKNGDYLESMIQKMYRKLSLLDKENNIIITTLKEQVPLIKNQIGEQVKICVEPCRKDTFPATVLAASYLYDVEKIAYDEPVVVCPVDPFVGEKYFEALKNIAEFVVTNDAELTLMGIEPTYPSEKYGYIIPLSDKDICFVKAFKEKPDIKTAESYLEQGALWNSGIFAFKLGYLLERAHQIIRFSDYYDLYNKYSTLTSISFDYAIVEKTKKIQVMRFSGKWSDIRTWNTLTEVMDETYVGNVIMDEKCKNTHVVNELDMPVLCMGTENVVVAASPQGILVSDKERSSYIKPYIDQIGRPIMFAEKTWGSFQILDIGDASVTIKVILKTGKHMNYHSHEKRSEVWTIISGEGKAIINDTKQYVKAGDVITLNAGVKHTICAETELKLIEVQLGKEININDKKVYNYKI